MLLRDVDIVDEVLRSHSAELGPDFAAYRNHVYRVLNFCAVAIVAGPRVPRKDRARRRVSRPGYLDGLHVRLSAAVHPTGECAPSPNGPPRVDAGDYGDDPRAPQALPLSRRFGSARRIVSPGGLDRRVTRRAPFRPSEIGRRARLFDVAERRLPSATPRTVGQTRTDESNRAASDDSALTRAPCAVGIVFPAFGKLSASTGVQSPGGSISA